ncbi:MAG: PilZ domain-containing protein [Ilumatobacteraceae bacterium]
MRRKEHLVARAVVVAGLAAGLCYLVWRALFSLAGTDLWLSLPVLLVEVTGFVGSALLVWALWPHQDDSAGDVSAVEVAVVDVLVRVHQQDDNELRATLIALRSVTGVGEVIVSDASSLAVAMAAVRTPRFLLLDAGDVPTTDIVKRLSRAMADERVAVVQGFGVSLADDSIEHGPHGRHDLTFERAALNPALSTRGCAIWTGSGSLVCVDALRESLMAEAGLEQQASLEVYWSLSAVMLSAGWRIAAPADAVVVAHRAEQVESNVHADRRARVRAARRLLAGCRRSFALRQRMAMLAWCVRPFSGLRRAVFISVLVCAIYAGSAPFTAPAWVLLATWLPGFVATSVGLSLLSGWRLRPGDRTRWSLLSMGPACSNWRAASSPTVAPLPGAQFGVGLVVAVTTMCLVLVLRGISDQFTHALGALSSEVLLALIVVALWTLALSLDELRLMARRTQRRGSARVVSTMPAMLGERSAKIVDLTPHGAGLLSQTAIALGKRVMLVSTITTASGVTEMRVPCVVRRVSPIDGDCWRIGVNFDDVEAALDAALVDALIEFCIVEPTWERLGVMPYTSVTEARRMHVDESDSDAFIGRGMLRFLSLVALVGAVASSVSGNFEATRSGAPWMAWLVVAFAGVIGGSLLLGLASPHSEHGQAPISEPVKSSSASPDLAIR